MHQPEPTWTEFDWELALRESDQVAERYFHLLKRFCDLPDAEGLIAQHMGEDYRALNPDLELGEEFEMDYDEENSEYEDWIPADENGDSKLSEENICAGCSGPVGGPLFYESSPAFVILRRAATSWCNIYAVVLPPEARPPGLRVLFHLGRSLANLAYSIDDDVFDQRPASIAFAKRGLAHLNEALGGLNQLIEENSWHTEILVAIRHHLMKANEAVQDHLAQCRGSSDHPGEIGA